MFDWQKVASFDLQSLEEWNSVVSFLKSKISQQQVLLLDGPMGAGKTELVKRLVQALGGRWVSSPTFALHNQYAISTLAGTLPPSGVDAFTCIDHWDLYRLESEDELESSGFYDGFSVASGLIIVEWAARLDIDSIPWNWAALHLKISVQDKQRHVEIYKKVKT